MVGNKMAKQKMTRAQKQAKIEAAQKREERAEAAREARERSKKIFTVVVCVILVLALGIPTVAIAVLGGGGA